MEKELHILMLEDDPADAELEVYELRKSGLVCISQVVETKEAFLKALDEFSPDIILSDYDLPSFDGLAALKIAKEKCPDVPFILVTGKLGEEFAIEKLKEGATDYVLKGNLKRLVPSVKRALEEAMQIRERRKAEEALRWKTTLLEAQINATIDGILIVDEKGNKIIQNQRCIDLWKIPQHIVDNRDDKQQVEFVMNSARDPQKFVEKVVYLYNHPDETSHEELEFKDGTVLDRYSAPVIGKDGTHFGRIWMFRDVTEQRQAEAALQASEAGLRAILDATPFPIALVNVQGDSIAFWSRSALNLFGHTAPTATEWYRIAYPDPDYRRDVINRWETALEKARLSGQAVNTGEYRITCRDGSVRICELYATFLSDKLIVTFNDITERKKLEAQLLLAQKIEATGLLAGGIAHDFNNLLQSIIMGIAIAKTRSNEDRVKEILVRAENECLKAEGLSNLLITFSKGGTPIVQKSSIADMLKETVAHGLKGSPVQTEITMPDDLWPVKIDEGQIRIAITQLVMNAGDAMPSGGMLKVQARNLESIAKEYVPLKEGQYVKITFADNGAGISPENLSRIFDPYFTTKQMGSQKGMGLSLTVSQSIIKKHEGIITAESKAGAGATFHIYLPAAKDA